MTERRVDAGLILVLALGLAAGLCGLRSGLPGPARWRALPPTLKGSPDFASRLADDWRKLYSEIERSHREKLSEEPVTYVRGEVAVPAGWSFPPEPLVNSARSLMTQTENPDEKKTFIILSRMRPWKFEFEPLYVQYGGAFVYPFGAFLGAAHALRLAHLTPDLSYYLARPEEMGRLYLLGRVFVLLFHLGTLWALYALGGRLAGPRAGLAAALLFACAPFVASYSHMLKPHPVSAFWFVLSALFAARAIDEGGARDYALCGLAAGLAAGGSLTLVFALGLPVLARLCAGKGEWRAPLAACALAVAVVVAANPYLLFSPDKYAWELTVYSPTRLGLGLRTLRAMIFSGIPHSVGALSAFLLAVGTVAAIFGTDRRGRACAWLVIGGSIILWLRFSSVIDESFLRVFYGPFAIACVLGGALAARLPRAAAVVVLALALAESGARAACVLTNLSLGTGPSATRERAADWIDANIPAGARVGLLRFPAPPYTPPFRWDRVALVAFDKPESLLAPPQWIVASRAGWADVDESFRKRYDEAVDFRPAAPLGIVSTDEGFYTNAGFVVLRLIR